MIGSATMNKLMNDQFISKSERLHALLGQARRVTICLDGWTKNGLSSSYVGISACFFDPSTALPRHAFLNLSEMGHPHTGEKLAECLHNCLAKWGITPEKIILVISDNGSNMIKAIKLLQKTHPVR